MLNFLFLSIIIALALSVLLRGRQSLGSLAVLFGILFPIDVLGGVNPLFIDILRYVLALVLIISIRPEPRRRSPLALVATMLLLGMNFIAIMRALLAEHTGVAFQSLVGIVSIILAYLVTKNVFLNRKMLVGFLVGSAWSALDIILQVLGLPYLGTATEWGTRYPGLGLSSTNTAPFLALGLALVISNFLWVRSIPLTIIRLGTGILLATGLLLSGGRGGIAGITLAIVVFFAVQLRRHPLLAITLAAVGSAWLLPRTQQISDFLTRSGSDSGLTTGRDILNASAGEAFIRGGAFGIDLSTWGEYRPHTPILSFALSTGAVGLVTTIVLTGFIVWRLFHVANNGTTSSTLIRMISAVILVTTLLEPWGFFVGLSKGVLLMMAYRSRLDGSISNSSPPHRTQPHLKSPI